MKTVVGIDLGTQSLKAVFYDYSARSIVASESAALGLYQNDDGAAEQQAQLLAAPAGRDPCRGRSLAFEESVRRPGGRQANRERGK